MLAAEKADRVLARDVSEEKTTLIEENLERMQLDNVAVEVFDATRTDERYLNTADVLIMDVPCSGLGVMGKKRDIKYHASPEGLKSIVALQKRIVEHSWQYVKPGGTLLYSTCTINPAENEEMVRWIVDHLPFEPVSLEGILPENLLAKKQQADKQRPGFQEKYEKKLRDAFIQLLPGYVDADGFFFAILRRK